MLGSVRSAWKSGFTRGIPSNFLYFLFTMDAGTPPWTSSKRRKGRNSRVIRGRTIKRERETLTSVCLALIRDRKSIEKGPIVSYLSSRCREVYSYMNRPVCTDISGYRWNWWKCILSSCFIVEKCSTSEYMENICKIEKINTFPRVSVNFSLFDKWISYCDKNKNVYMSLYEYVFLYITNPIFIDLCFLLIYSSTVSH